MQSQTGASTGSSSSSSAGPSQGATPSGGSSSSRDRPVPPHAPVLRPAPPPPAIAIYDIEDSQETIEATGEDKMDPEGL